MHKMHQCVLCNLLSCLPGFYSSGCVKGSTGDAVCLPCKPVAGPYAWTRNCEFECAANFWLNGTACAACTPPAGCAAGFYASNCSRLRDAQCLPCPYVPGPVVWAGGGCNFTCADGYAWDGAACGPLIAPVPASEYDPGESIMAALGVVSVGTMTLTAFFGQTVLRPRVRVWKT